MTCGKPASQWEARKRDVRASDVLQLPSSPYAEARRLALCEQCMARRFGQGRLEGRDAAEAILAGGAAAGAVSGTETAAARVLFYSAWDIVSDTEHL